MGLVVSSFIFLVLFLILHSYLSGYFRRLEKYNLIGISADSPAFFSTIAGMSDSLRDSGEILHFWSNVDEIQAARLNLISQARSQILFETFIMTPGKRSAEFAEVLIKKASEGVFIQLLADSYGTRKLPKTYWQKLENAGVEVRFFNPFSWRAPLDYFRRNHRKLLIVDQAIAMIGGAGIADRWDGKDSSSIHTPWYDFEIQLEGAVVSLLSAFFWQHWLSAGGLVNLREDLREQTTASNPSPILLTPGEDPTFGNSPIRSLFQLCVASAERRLWIASPYLLPDDMTCKMLSSACQRGADVRILTMGAKCDKPYVYKVSQERYGKLLRAGVKIHEYQPSMMHAKILLLDDRWVSLGSANLDPRSFFHNDELNLCTNTSHLIRDVNKFFEIGFQNSKLIQYESWSKRPLTQKIQGQLGSLFYWQM